MHNDFILELYSRPESVFTVNDLALVFPNISYESLRDRLYYFSRIGKLKKIHHGVYAKENYSSFELANKLYRPSYISLETVLARGGVTFQYYDTIFAVTYLTRSVSVKHTKIQYRQIKGEVLINMDGIEKKTGFFMATLERAFLDAVYIYKNYHFDNLGVIDWDKVDKLKKIYKNKAFEKRVKEYHELQDE